MYVLTDFARWFVLDRSGDFLTYLQKLKKSVICIINGVANYKCGRVMMVIIE